MLLKYGNSGVKNVLWYFRGQSSDYSNDSPAAKKAR